MPEQLPAREYAELLSGYIDRDSHPNWEFDNIVFDFIKNDIIQCKNMLEVECIIGKKLHENDLDEVKDGLLKTIHWFFQFILDTDERNDARQRFYASITNEAVHGFHNKLKTWKSSTNNGETMSSESIFIRNINNLRIHAFNGITIVSIILMFIDPKKYPGINWRIVNNNRDFFQPFENLNQSLRSRDLTCINAYQKWARFCREMARKVNKIPGSQYQDVRAVDFERAILRAPEDDRKYLFAGPTDNSHRHISHIDIQEDQRGICYEDILIPYLKLKEGTSMITIIDRHIKSDSQIRNLDELLAAMREGKDPNHNISVHLFTNKADNRNAGRYNMINMRDYQLLKFQEFRNTYQNNGICFTWKFGIEKCECNDAKCTCLKVRHDREIITNTGCYIIMLHGLDIFRTNDNSQRYRQCRPCSIRYATDDSLCRKTFDLAMDMNFNGGYDVECIFGQNRYPLEAFKARRR